MLTRNQKSQFNGLQNMKSIKDVQMIEDLDDGKPYLPQTIDLTAYIESEDG
jgi:hypothetical protein